MLRAAANPIGPNAPVTHTYNVFAGPKTIAALTPYGAEELASYRKGYTFWGATTAVAQYVITPLLGFTYELTRKVGNLSIPFGIVYANHGEFLGDVDARLSAHLGLKFNMSGGNGNP